MVYQTLDSNRHGIRLLTVKVDESPIITCTLNTVALLDEPSFKALSYQWGREKAPQLLLLDGEEMEITANLDKALRQLRQENHSPLFVDALCINQSDNSEKSEQVMLMKEIYSKATEVIAWLGPAECQSDGAMELMKTFGKFAPQSEMTPGIVGGNISSEGCFADEVALWDAVDGLLGRPYWQRTWILQELVLAKTVLFRCGTKSATFEDLHSLYSAIARRTNSPNVQELTLKAAHLQSIALILSLRDLDGMNRDGIPLTSILAESEDQLVSDLRDKVYGLLGMASDASILVPLPSYDISAGEAYVHFTRSLIVKSQRLAYICFKSPFGKSSLEIPSWAMDLSTPCFDASSALSQDILHIPLNWKAGAEANVVFNDSSYGKETVLVAWGRVMGTVDGIGSVLPIHSSFSSSQYDIVEPDYSMNIYGSETATLEAILVALLGIARGSSKNPLEHSFQLQCHKFSIKALMKPGNRGLLASIPELLEWLDKNKEFIFAGRSLSSWSTLAAESVPVWKGSWIKEALMRPRGSFPHERTVGSHLLALGQGIEGGVEAAQTGGDIDSLEQNIASLDIDEVGGEGHTESARQVPRLDPEGGGVGGRRRELAVLTNGLELPNASYSSTGPGSSQSSRKVFNRLVRAHRNAAAALSTRFPVAASLHCALESSSLTDNELEKIELTVKALLANLIRYRRIFTTSVGSIGMAHPQVRKNDKICSFHGSGSTLVILREEPLPSDKLPRMAAREGQRSSGTGVSNEENQEYKIFRVIGEATLAGSFNQKFVPQDLKWELFALI
jgi:hypothetical protein